MLPVRIEKLLRLSKSDNLHEAEMAFAEASRLAAVLGVNLADAYAEEIVTVPIDGKSDFIREEIAFAVASSRGCVVASGPLGLRVRGSRRAVDDVAVTYGLAIREMEAIRPPAAFAKFKAVSAAWLEVYRLGFAGAMTRRLLPVSKPLDVVKVEGVSKVEPASRAKKLEAAVAGSRQVVDRMEQELRSFGLSPMLARTESWKYRDHAAKCGEEVVKTLPIANWTVPSESVMVRGCLPPADPADIAAERARVAAERRKARAAAKAAKIAAERVAAAEAAEAAEKTRIAEEKAKRAAARKAERAAREATKRSLEELRAQAGRRFSNLDVE